MKFFIIMLSLCICGMPALVNAEGLSGGAYEVSGVSVNGVRGTLQGGNYTLQGDILTVSGVISGSPYVINTGYLPSSLEEDAPISSGGGGGGGGSVSGQCPVTANPQVVIDATLGTMITISPSYGMRVIFGSKVYTEKTQFMLYPTQTVSYIATAESFGAKYSCSVPVQVVGGIVPAKVADTSCTPFVKRLKIGAIGSEVARVQAFLKKQGYRVDKSGIFGPRTERAVLRFQKKYLKDIVLASGSRAPTGLWYEYTMKKANSITGCIGVVEKNNTSKKQVQKVPTQKEKAVLLEAIPVNSEELTSCRPFTQNLQIGAIGSEVRRMQKFLIVQGYELDALGIFGPKTRRAIEQFQERYRNEIIAPTNAKDPTGLWHEYTRMKANRLMGCSDN